MNQDKARYNRNFIIYFIIFSLFFGGRAVWKYYTSYPDTPVEVQIDGKTIVPGRTTVAELLDQGFILTDSSPKQRLVTLGDPSGGTSGDTVGSELYYDEIKEPGDWQIKGGGYETVRLLCGNAEAARLGLVNRSESGQSLLQCTVHDITLKPFEWLADGEYSVDGISMTDLTAEKITSQRGKPERQYEETTDDGGKLSVTVWKGSRYGLSVKEKTDGSIAEITVR